MTTRQNRNDFYQGQVKLNGEFITYHKIDHDFYGNPRYLIHFTAMDVKYDDPRLNKVGFKRYRGNWFGGGLVITSYSLEDDLQRAYNELHHELTDFKAFVSETIEKVENGIYEKQGAKNLLNELQRQMVENGHDTIYLTNLLTNALDKINTISEKAVG